MGKRDKNSNYEFESKLYLNCFFPSNSSSLSSRTQSLDSVLSDVQNPSYSTSRSVYNVNTSTVFQLQQINGMNQELAAKLVEYRTRKGPFKSLDDLVKVKGLSQSRLYAIKGSLCCNDNGEEFFLISFYFPV